MLTFDAALQTLIEAARPINDTELVPLEAAGGRVLAAPVLATVDVPALANSAMDGYAVRAAEANAAMHAGRTLPVSQRIAAGKVGEALASGSVARIFTGAPVPEGADAVVMQEHCQADAAGVRFTCTVEPGANIRRAGEDMRRAETVLAAGIRLRPQDVALAAAAGVAKLSVFRRLRVALLLTGDELATPGQPLPPGAIYDSNRYALRAQLEAIGCTVRDFGHVADQLDATRAALLEMAADSDVILTSGGVSVGEEDHVKAAVESTGRLTLWKIAIKPGKPLAFGEIFLDGRGIAFFGLPGNPVSSFITFATLVRPFILRRQGQRDVLPHRFLLPAGFARTADEARTEFLRVRIGADGRLEAFSNQGSGVVTSLAWSDGLAQLTPHKAVAPGDGVAFIPFAELL